MQIEINKQMLIHMVKGTGGPGTYGPYSSAVDRIGRITGFPNEKWEWDELALRVMNEEQLLAAYNDLTNKN